MANEIPREKRLSCHGDAALYLAAGKDGTSSSCRLRGRLLNISNHGVSIALAEIISDRKHMAYTPMESDQYTLYVVLYSPDEEISVPVKTVWFNKKLGDEELPFRIGMEFLEPLTPEQVKKIASP